METLGSALLIVGLLGTGACLVWQFKLLGLRFINPPHPVQQFAAAFAVAMLLAAPIRRLPASTDDTLLIATSVFLILFMSCVCALRYQGLWRKLESKKPNKR